MIAAAVRQAAALLLDYPGPGWPRTLTHVRDALGGLDDPRCAPVLRFCAAVADDDPRAAEERYVLTFDRDRRRTLHMTYYSDGDTRRRGAALVRLKDVYRREGWRPSGGELPDHLPVMLEFAARCPEPGERLLRAHRPGLDLLRLALHDRRSPYAALLDAVCATLPGPTPADRAAVAELARSGPVIELVGLDGYGETP
ncbi:nitrate reductase molybdenum cofactor assembly chaperone [Actinomadura atramentaria]|uniref:nitrate reductase molybdenum cofactor assembly chaperone n=1 Tax=Actinomadura atramentaria TaxID=1990 RepID=UPI000372AD94|nr:nitrate reductase molybdenum cofactor assembly chaperone [Actinomadura atramentaria]